MQLNRTYRLSALLALLLAPAAAGAQPEPGTGDAVVIAIPPLATAKRVETDAGDTWALANQIADLISADLKSTDRFIVADVKDVRFPSYPEVTAPAYPQWRAAGTKLLLSGFVNARPDGRLTVGCYVYDVQSGRELSRKGFAVTPSEWRRAAHRCADAAYTTVSGNLPTFDSRIAYVAESGSPDGVVKRIAMMDFDGANHTYLTDGSATVITPRWSADGKRVAYTSFAAGHLHIRIADASGSGDRPLLSGAGDHFSPAFSPDGDAIALAMIDAGNTDIFLTDADGRGMPRRLTTAPGIDTSPSFSPDGQRIAFTSDRSGRAQIYVMDADGSNQRRVSFGPGDYGSPVWSPDGEHLAFTNAQGGASRIGVMNAAGSDERIVTRGNSDEQPSWSPDGARIVFQKFDSAARRATLAMVPLRGGEERAIPTPQGATDPAWAGQQE